MININLQFVPNILILSGFNKAGSSHFGISYSAAPPFFANILQIHYLTGENPKTPLL